MTFTDWGAAIAVATAAAGFLTAVLGIFRYFNYRTRRDRIAAVGVTLDAVVASLAGASEIQRAAAAIRLRRFFDRRSELGVSGAAYAADALGVMAAVLRELPVGTVQKLLADGLAHAPSLAGADLQRTNLRNAYLARTDVAGADFFQADLTDGSLKGADARGAVFYQTQLVRSILIGADLRGATFRESDLREALLTGARLAGARFSGCRHLPGAIVEGLDGDGIWVGPEQVPAGTAAAPVRRIFVSRPSALSPQQRSVVEQITATLSAAGVDVVTVASPSASPAGILADVRQVMAGCAGAVILGLRQFEVADGRARPGTPRESAVAGIVLPTPWNHVEAGLATGLGLPLFRAGEDAYPFGAFDPAADAEPVSELQVRGLDAVLTDLRAWLARIVPEA